MNRSIVLVSGGLDSAVTAAIAVKKSDAAFLHVNYGQRTEARELEAFNAIADYFKVKTRLVADITYLAKIGGSALTDPAIEVPTEMSAEGVVPVTYVPFRNAHLLAIAVSWAEVIGAKEIYIGAVEEDASGYPDCRREFFDSFETTIALGTKPVAAHERPIHIVTPIIDRRKSEIIKTGVELGAPLDLTWSCYSDSHAACGVCESCTLRLKAFKEAGKEDSITYAP